MSGCRDDLTELRAALAAGLQSWSEALLGPRNRKLSSHREWRWGNKGALSVVVGGPDRGGWFDHEAGQGGGPLDLVMFGARLPFLEAVEWGRKAVGGSAELAQHRPAPRDHAADDRAKGENEAVRIELARAIWAASIPIAGTLAEHYLTAARAIPAPPGGWPADALRFHAPSRSLMAVATTAGGNITAIQRVRLLPNGLQDKDPPIAKGARPGVTKPTTGVLSGIGAAVRLPGDAARPLLVAEGPETSLSVWAATGCETWAALGSVSNITPPAGRVVILCRDDDKEWSPGDRALRKAVAAWRAAGIVVKVATPWPERRGDKSDFNDTIKAGGADAVRARIEAAQQSSAGRNRVPIVAARRALGAVVERFFALAAVHDAESDLPPVHAVRVDVGVGKSRAAREHAAELLATMRARGDLRPVVVAVPTHRLGEEQAQAFASLPTARKAGLTVAIWRGRGADDPERPGETVCREMARVHDAMAAGANVQTAACRSKVGKTIMACPFFEDCGYQRQRQRQADLWIVPHELLFMERPTTIAEPAALIVDESAWQDGLEGAAGQPRTLALDSFGSDDAVPLGNLESARLAYLRRLARDAMRGVADGPLRRETMRATGMTPASAREAHKLEWSRYAEPHMHPGMTAAERKAAVKASEGNRTVRRFSSFWTAAEAILADGAGEASGWAEIAHQATDDGTVRVVRLKGRRPVCAGWQVPTLLLDATLNIDLVRPHWPAAEMVADVAATAPHQRVVQVTDASYSLRRLAPRDDLPEADQRRRARNLRDLHARLAEIGRDYAPGRVLVVAQKAIEAALPSIGRLPPSVTLAHHNSVAGRDEWRDVEALVVVGRTAPPPAAVERQAEALTGRAVPQVEGWYPKVATHREMADGDTLDAEADCHPDPIAEAIRWTVAEGELVQIIGRARGVNRTKSDPVTVIVLTDVPLPLAVDGTTTQAQLTPDPTELMLAAGGIAFANSSDAAAAYPAIWENAKAAKNAMERAEPRWASFPNKKSLIRERGSPPAGLRQVDYQRPGPGKRLAVAWIDPALVPDPAAALAAMLGPLAWCRPAAEIVRTPVAPPMPMALPDLPAAPRVGNLAFLWDTPSWLALLAQPAAEARAGPS